MAHNWQKDLYTLTYHFQGKRRIFLMVVVLPLLVGLLTGGLPAEAAHLENPGEGQVYSGIGVISGWKCEADGPLTIRFNGGPPVPLVYGSERPDTRSVCGDANNGFVAIWNWGNLHADTQTARATSGSSSSFNTVHADTHTARVYDNGVLFAETTFQVGTLGVEFLRGFGGAEGAEGGIGLVGSGLVEGGWSAFNMGLVWNENTQHFEVGYGKVWYSEERPSGEQYSEWGREIEERREQDERYREDLEQRPPGWHAEAARLENPGDSQIYSGIGAISGWKCEADGPLTIRFNDGRSIPLVYGSERTDTRPVCGDANNGFVAIWNWGNLGDGIHTARVYDNGVAFAETTFQVGTLGVEFWPGTSCYTQDICGKQTFSSTLINESSATSQPPYDTRNQLGPYGYVGYDGAIWAAPGTASDTWNTYFKWNANTQHFEAFARRRYQRRVIPEPPPAWRWQEPSFEDRPDDFSGPQIHVYHAEPRDARGSSDMIGHISATVQAAQRWLATRTDQGRAFRIDTYQGRPDVTTLPLAVTTAEMQAYKPETLFDVPILPGGVSLKEFGRHDPHKLHVVFIEAPPARDGDDKFWTSICEGAAESVAIVFAGLSGLPAEGVPPSPYCSRLSSVFVHEVFHLLGAVHPDAPHSDGTGHIDGDFSTKNEGYLDEDGRPLRDSDLPFRHDLMNPLGHEEAELDIGSDDYYFHPEKTPVWPPPEYDTVDSPFFTAGPWTDITRTASSHALQASPPEGASATDSGNQAEAAPYPTLLEPLPEGPDGPGSGGWCFGVVD